MTSKKDLLRKWIIGLSLFGIFLASYLFLSYLFRPSYQPCSINSFINCDAVIKGEVAKTFGIPTALYGLIGYTIILYAALSRSYKLLFGMALFGTLFCLRITFIEVFQLKVYCPVCLTCQLVMLSILCLSFFQIKTSKD